MVDDLGLTREEIGRRVGCSRASISNHLRLLDLPDDALDLIDTGRLTFAHGRALLLCDDHATRRQLAHRAHLDGWSKRRLEDEARRAGAPRARRRSPTINADQEAFAHRLSEAVSSASGLGITVQAGAGDQYRFTVQGQPAARALANQLGAGEVDEPPLRIGANADRPGAVTASDPMRSTTG
jgi:ParB family chromosome partitioning protein